MSPQTRPATFLLRDLSDENNGKPSVSLIQLFLLRMFDLRRIAWFAGHVVTAERLDRIDDGQNRPVFSGRDHVLGARASRKQSASESVRH